MTIGPAQGIDVLRLLRIDEMMRILEVPKWRTVERLWEKDGYRMSIN